MRRNMMGIGLLAGLLAQPAAAWEPLQVVKTYTIEGQTPGELYAAIGRRGPQVGGLGRAIALTHFKLTWQRHYEPRGAACVLAAARPKLTVITTLPKPASRLPADTQRGWDQFIAGVAAHERVHGTLIVAMVRAIETTSVGLTVEADPGCRKIRTELTKRLGVLSEAQRQQSRDFDRLELNAGGGIHQLILRFVNGR